MAQQQEEFQAAPATAATAEAPIPCVNNCGFFGSRATLNLCSQCFRKSPATVTASVASASRMVEIEISSPAAEAVPVVITGKIRQRQAVAAAAAEGNPGRCGWCRKRVGLSAGFKCRCGTVFCSQHRYSDEHQCSFDYKAAGRESIAKANPLVVASKINKI